jgi:hypothetical protein
MVRSAEKIEAVITRPWLTASIPQAALLHGINSHNAMH